MTDVGEWLDLIGLGQYTEAFEKNAIGWDVLSHLDHDVLKDIGVYAAGDRVRILYAIKSLRAERGNGIAGLSRIGATPFQFGRRGTSPIDGPVLRSGRLYRPRSPLGSGGFGRSRKSLSRRLPVGDRTLQRFHRSLCRRRHPGLFRLSAGARRRCGTRHTRRPGYRRRHEDVANGRRRKQPNRTRRADRHRYGAGGRRRAGGRRDGTGKRCARRDAQSGIASARDCRAQHRGCSARNPASRPALFRISRPRRASVQGTACTGARLPGAGRTDSGGALRGARAIRHHAVGGTRGGACADPSSLGPGQGG